MKIIFSQRKKESARVVKWYQAKKKRRKGDEREQKIQFKMLKEESIFAQHIIADSDHGTC